jgi:hypothetical protein
MLNDFVRWLKHTGFVLGCTVILFYLGGIGFMVYLGAQGYQSNFSPSFIWEIYAALISNLRNMTDAQLSAMIVMVGLGWVFPLILSGGLVPRLSPWRTVPKSGPTTKHVRGLTREDNQRRFAKLAAKAISKGKEGIRIHQNVSMPSSAENEGVLVLGGTGSGKTKSVINRIFKEAWARGEKVIVLDSKGDFTAHCDGSPGVYLLAPWDTRSVAWDLGQDISRVSDVDMIATAILPPIPGDHQPIFRDTAYVILVAVMKSLWQDGNLTWKNLHDAVNAREKLIAVLSAYDSGASALAVVTGDPEQAERFLSTLRTATAFLYQLAQAWPGKPHHPFSIREWMRDGHGGILILRYSSDFVDVSRRTSSLASSIAIAELLSWPVTGQTPVWFLLDEVANLGTKIGNLAEGITAGRERGGKFVVATQDVSRLYDLYGQNEARSLLNSLRTFVAFSCADKTNAEYAADCLGAEQEQILETVSKGNTEGKKNSKSVTRQSTFRMTKVVLASELFQLDKGQAFMRLPGLPVAKLQFDQVLLRSAGQHESLADWVHARETRRQSAAPALLTVKPRDETRVVAKAPAPEPAGGSAAPPEEVAEDKNQEPEAPLKAGEQI